MAFLTFSLLPVTLLLTSLWTGDIATVETTADAAVIKGRLDGTKDVLSITSPSDAILLRFRVALVERWSIQKAVVAVHLADSQKVPAQVNIGVTRGSWTESESTPPPITAGQTVAIRALKDGWITFELPQKVCTELEYGKISAVLVSVPDGESLSIHSRRTGQYMPYLLVRGQGSLIRKVQ